jgi:dienelactone hydrolase
MKRIFRLVSLFALLFASAAAFVTTAAGAAPQVIDVEWKDAARDRVLPLKLRIPDGSGKVPLVIFSHGLGGSREGGKAWGEHWSQNGYFVIHVQHPGSDQTLMKDGSGAPLTRLKRGANAEQLLGRVDDIRFVLDEIAKRQASGDASVARIDATRVAMTGHSFGAVTTMTLADMRHQGPIKTLADSRFKAFIAFSPQVQGAARTWPDRYGEMKRPFLTVTGTLDGDMIGNGANPDKRAALFDAQPPGDKYRVIFENGDHMVFNGGAVRESEIFAHVIEHRNKRTDATTAATIQEKTKLITLKYLDAYLKDDAGAKLWLIRDAAKALGDAGSWATK